MNTGTASMQELVKALRETWEGGKGIRMNPKDTTFDGIDERPQEETDAEVVDAVRSVPCHY